MKMIKLNGFHRHVPEAVSYERIVRMAFGYLPGALATVGYSAGPQDSPEGTLKPGQSVAAVDGMIFDVDVT